MFNVLSAKIDQLKICSDVSSNTTNNSLSTGNNDSIFTSKNKFDSIIFNSSVDVNMNCYEHKESFRKTSDLVLTEMLEQHDAVLSAIGSRISMNNKKVAAIVILTKNEIWCSHFKLGSNSLDDYMKLKAFAEMMNYASIKFRNKSVNLILTSDYVFKFLQNRNHNFCLAYLGKGIRADLGKQILEAEKKFLSFKYTVNQSSFVTSILNDTGILGSVEGSVNDLQAFAEMMNYASIKFRNKSVNLILTSDYVFKFLQNRNHNFCLAYLGKGIRADLGKQILEAEKKFLSFKYTVNQSSFVTSILNDTGILGSVEGSVNDLQFLQNRNHNFCLAYLGKGIRADLGKQILEAEKKFLSFKYTVNQSSFVTSILNDTGILGSVEGSVNDLQVYPQRYEKFSNYFF
uniref:Transcriptional regulator n=1 Tax=Strongyloides venezuelensis TaxID=75913 RepID=A0A0K0FJL7_STRVS